MSKKILKLNKSTFLTILNIVFIMILFIILFDISKSNIPETSISKPPKDSKLSTRRDETLSKDVGSNDIDISKLYPKQFLTDNVKSQVPKALKDFEENGHRGITVGMGPYNTYENYMYFRDIGAYKKNSNVKLDENGFPMIFYEEGYFYNPVSFSQFSLSMYSDYIYSEDNKEKEKLKKEYIKCADFLITLQEKDGSFRYPFEWYNFNSGETYPKGWVSSMAQGHALSVYARAYYLTKDKKYIENGNKVFNFMIKHKDQGGTLTTLEDIDPKYKDYIFFEEYVSTPDTYTLNGYIFTLFGIYDWIQINNDYPKLEIGNTPDYYFYEGIESLKLVLPLFDIDGFSTYDLGHIVYKNDGHIVAPYHSIHIIQLSNLYTITGEKIFYDYQKLWTSYVEDIL